jgi:hypothetical protein
MVSSVPFKGASAYCIHLILIFCLFYYFSGEWSRAFCSKAPLHTVYIYFSFFVYFIIFLVNGLEHSVQRRLCILHRADTQFTCFTSTKVLVQKYKYWCDCVAFYGAYCTALKIDLLALLVQKYKY